MILYSHYLNILSCTPIRGGGGTRWRSCLRHCATSRKVSCSFPDGFFGIFHWQFFRPHYEPGVDTASNRNEYQEYFLEGKRRPVRRADNLTTFIYRLSWNLGTSTSWKTSGPVQICNGIALPLSSPPIRPMSQLHPSKSLGTHKLPITVSFHKPAIPQKWYITEKANTNRRF
jgi:hypothetical protein